MICFCLEKNLIAAYSRYKERRAHIASFCGTGNDIKEDQRLNAHRSVEE